MASIFITGSADGLGLLTARALVKEGHSVVLHARNEQRGQQAMANVPGAEAVLTADLWDMDETKELASKVNKLRRFDAIIHNAGVYQVPNKLIFFVNTIAPYILTSLIHMPARLVYLSSGMHRYGDASLKNMPGDNQAGNYPNYSDSKLHNVILAMAVARKWKDVCSNAVDPGWVPTKMGGRGAPDNLEKGFQTQVWLAVSNDKAAKVSGRYFHHQKEAHYLSAANDVDIQEDFMRHCEKFTGVRLKDEK
jgi:NAD(P)-dependent dehydrogenase (short-subunit alcohol dehydrogenase family)